MKFFYRIVFRFYNLAPRPIWNWSATFLGIGNKGYDSESVVQMIVEKNISWDLSYNEKISAYENQKIITAIAHHISSIKPTTINVLDFGGGGGHSFTIAKSVFKDITMRWVVVEREKITKVLTERISQEGLHFTSNLTEAHVLLDSVDLVFCNSALQYTQNPLDSLGALLKLNSKTIFVTRTPFTSSNETVSYIQPSLSGSNGPGHAPANLHSTIEGYRCNVVPLQEALHLFRGFYKSVKVFDEGKWDDARSSRFTNSYTILATNPFLL